LGIVTQLEFSSLGDRVLYLDEKGQLGRWEVEKNQLAKLELESKTLTFGLAGHGRLAVGYLETEELVELNLNADGSTRVSPTGVVPPCDVKALTLDAEGQQLFGACERELVAWLRGGQGWEEVARYTFPARILDITRVGEELAVLHGHEGEVNLSAVGLKDRVFNMRELALGLPAARGLVGATRLEDLAVVTSNGLLGVPSSPAAEAPILRAGRSGMLHHRGATGLASAEEERINVRTSTGSLNLRGHRAPIRFLRASSIEARLLSVDATGHARVWRPGSGTPRIPLHGAGGIVTLDMSERGDVLIAGAGDGSVRRIPLEAVGLKAELLGKHPGELRAVYSSPDGSRVASVGRDAGIRVWGEFGSEAQRFGTDRQAARSVTWSADGSVVAAGTCTIAESCGTELFWPQTGRSVWIDGLDRAPIELSLAPRLGRIAAVEPHDSGARLWIGDLTRQGPSNGDPHVDFEKVDREFGRIEAIAHDDAGWLTVGAIGSGDTLEIWRVDPRGRSAQLGRVEGVSGLAADHGVLAWQRGQEVNLYDLRKHTFSSLIGFDTPLAAIMMRRGGDAVALFSEIEDGVLAIDLQSRERRVVDVREPPLAWGLDFFDAPGTSLRSFDDRAPQEPEALAKWIAAQSKVWVEPSRMHRSVLRAPEGDE
jgi:WD40 repeat protein